MWGRGWELGGNFCFFKQFFVVFVFVIFVVNGKEEEHCRLFLPSGRFIVVGSSSFLLEDNQRLEWDFCNGSQSSCKGPGVWEVSTSGDSECLGRHGHVTESVEEVHLNFKEKDSDCKNNFKTAKVIFQCTKRKTTGEPVPQLSYHKNSLQNCYFEFTLKSNSYCRDYDEKGESEKEREKERKGVVGRVKEKFLGLFSEEGEKKKGREKREEEEKEKERAGEEEEEKRGGERWKEVEEEFEERQRLSSLRNEIWSAELLEKQEEIREALRPDNERRGGRKRGKRERKGDDERRKEFKEQRLEELRKKRAEKDDKREQLKKARIERVKFLDMLGSIIESPKEEGKLDKKAEERKERKERKEKKMKEREAKREEVERLSAAELRTRLREKREEERNKKRNEGGERGRETKKLYELINNI